MDKKNDFLEKKCIEYGLNMDTLKTYKDYIYLKNKYNDIVVVFDKNCNIISISRQGNYIDDMLFMQNIVNKYENCDENFIYSDYCSHYLKGLTLKEVIDLKDRIDSIHFENKVHLLQINGKWLDYEKDDLYQQFILYIKFLNNEIDDYINKSYSLMSLNINVLDIQDYIKGLINKIAWSISTYCSMDEVISTNELLKILGKFKNYCNKDFIQNVINLFTRINGYIVTDDKLVNNEFNIQNFNQIVDKVLHLLDISNEELEKNKNQGMIKLASDESINKTSEQIRENFKEEQKNLVKILNSNNK